VAISERTYTFRAPAELGDNIRELGQVMTQLGLDRDAHLADRVGREVARRLARRAATGTPAFTGGNQSAALRDIVELFVGAARKIASDLEWEKVYAADLAARTPEEIADDEARATWLRSAAEASWRDPEPGT
jgi:hypothetical protein